MSFFHAEDIDGDTIDVSPRHGGAEVSVDDHDTGEGCIVHLEREQVEQLRDYLTERVAEIDAEIKREKDKLTFELTDRASGFGGELKVSANQPYSPFPAFIGTRSGGEAGPYFGRQLSAEAARRVGEALIAIADKAEEGK